MEVNHVIERSNEQTGRFRIRTIRAQGDGFRPQSLLYLLCRPKSRFHAALTQVLRDIDPKLHVVAQELSTLLPLRLGNQIGPQEGRAYRVGILDYQLFPGNETGASQTERERKHEGEQAEERSHYAAGLSQPLCSLPSELVPAQSVTQLARDEKHENQDGENRPDRKLIK
jgi:hypothetical protein